MTDTVRFESLRRRPPVGTQVDLGGHSPIRFKADEETGREFADVPADKAHFLDAIPQAYRRVDENGEPLEAPKKARKPAAPAPVAPEYGATGNTDPDLVTVSDGDEGEGQDGAEGTDGNDTGVTQGDEPVELEAMDDDALRALFEKKIGRKPSPRAARETLIDQIKQATA
ncbi:hypothetical protein [Paracoccus sp. 22332]|uniref:hypothetical protein n=1 Tax=Paracoccus sp. 22332 TaxID=3453913 RepID=UPI003F84942A